MKKYIIIAIVLFLNSCETKNTTKEEKKTDIDSIINALKTEKKNIDITAESKKSISYYGQNGDIFTRTKDTVSSDNFDKFFHIIKDNMGNVILIQEIQDSEDEYTTISNYFNRSGDMFFNSIESFHFENPCQNGEIKDLRYVKDIFYYKFNVVSNEEYFLDDKSKKYKAIDCTFNGTMDSNIYKNLKDVGKQNKKLFELFTK